MSRTLLGTALIEVSSPMMSLECACSSSTNDSSWHSWEESADADDEATSARQLADLDYGDETWSSIILTLEFSLFAMVCLVAIFELGRSRTRLIYWPKRRFQQHRSPRRMPLGIGAWLPIAFTMPGHELRRLIGLDAYMMIRYLKLCMRLTAFQTVFGLCVLFPLFYSGDPTDEMCVRRTAASNSKVE